VHRLRNLDSPDGSGLNEQGHSGYCLGLSRASITEREAEKLDAAGNPRDALAASTSKWFRGARRRLPTATRSPKRSLRKRHQVRFLQLIQTVAAADRESQPAATWFSKGI